MSAPMTADFDLAGMVRVRVNGGAAEVAAVERQLGPLRTEVEGEPDIVIDVVERLPEDGRLRHLGRDEAGFTDDGFIVMRAKAKSRAMVRIPFEDVGGKCTITCEPGLPAVPLLIPVLAVTALAKGLVPLHAGAFSWNGKGVVVTGWSKGGKTETLIATTQRGARYVGDEWCYIDPDRREVVGIPEPVTLWAWHVRRFPELKTRVPRRDRLRMAVLDAPDRIESRLPESVQRNRIGRLLRRVAFQTRNRAHAWIPPGELFGVDGASVMALDRVVLVASVDRDDVELFEIEPDEIAARMVHSVYYELAPLLQHYRMYQFAFPGRSSPVLDRLDGDLREAMGRALAGTPAYVLEHPYPVDLAELADAIAPIVGIGHR